MGANLLNHLQTMIKFLQSISATARKCLESRGIMEKGLDLFGKTELSSLVRGKHHIADEISSSFSCKYFNYIPHLFELNSSLIPFLYPSSCQQFFFSKSHGFFFFLIVFCVDSGDFATILEQHTLVRMSPRDKGKATLNQLCC